MTFRLDITEIAMEQAFNLEAWIDSRQQGKGEAFMDALFACLQNLEAGPFKWAVVKQGIRRALVQAYQVAVFYRIEGDRVIVLAVMHQSADPGKWPR